MEMADFSVVILHSMLAFVILLTRVLAHEATNPLTSNNQQIHHADHVPLQKHAQSPDASRHQSQHAVHTMDRNIVQNQEHIMEHLDGKIQRPEETMSEEELQFHYFKVHDYDDNNMLDGIELISALTHHHEPNAKDEADAVNGMSEEEMSKTIDSILEENDLNKDGFIDYAEFVRNQRVADTNAV